MNAMTQSETPWCEGHAGIRAHHRGERPGNCHVCAVHDHAQRQDSDIVATMNGLMADLDAEEADYWRQLDVLNATGASDEQIVEVAVRRNAMRMALVGGVRPDEMAKVIVDALRHCGRLTKP